VWGQGFPPAAGLPAGAALPNRDPDIPFRRAGALGSGNGAFG